MEKPANSGKLNDFSFPAARMIFFDTATHWAIIDETNDKLLAAGALDSSESVTSGNTFTLPEFDIEQPDPS